MFIVINLACSGWSVKANGKTLVRFGGVCVGLLCDSLLSGCTSNVSARAPYKDLAGHTVTLQRRMAIWLPQLNNITYKSYPYCLEESDWKPYGFGARGEHIPDGEITAILPVGTPLFVEKVKHYNALDDVHDDALGTVLVTATGKLIKFDYMFNPFGHQSDPWIVR